MRRLAAAAFVWCFTFGALAAPAHAQYGARSLSDPATGEKYHVEVGGYFWNPTPDIHLTSESLGIIGSRIDFVEDLGIEKTRFKQLKVVLRPGRKQKLRFEFTPIEYDAVSTLKRDIVFNGQRYRVNVPVNSSLDWKALRLGYEYDFVVKPRGFAGFIIEDKQTDVRVDLVTPLGQIPPQFSHATAPIPALGGIARVYPHPRVSITGEVTGFRLPESINEDYKAHYLDVDVYATVNATKNVGFQAGFRALDLNYIIKQDSGTMTLKGLYFGLVARY